MRYDDTQMQVKVLNRKHIDEVVQFLEEVKDLELGDDEVSEIKDILIEGYSFGVYSERDLHGICLMYEVSFDGIQILFDEEPNALSAEPHIDYKYEYLENLENTMFKAIDRIVTENEFNYVVIQMSKTIREIRDNPRDLTKALIKAGYRFIESPDDVTIGFKEY